MSIPASKIIETREVFFLSKSSEKFILTSQLAPTKSFSTLLLKMLTYLTPRLYMILVKQKGGNMKTCLKKSGFELCLVCKNR